MKLVIDAFPHDLNIKKYNSENFVKTNAIALDDYQRFPLWALRFSDIYFRIWYFLFGYFIFHIYTLSLYART